MIKRTNWSVCVCVLRQDGTAEWVPLLRSAAVRVSAPLALGLAPDDGMLEKRASGLLARRLITRADPSRQCRSRSNRRGVPVSENRSLLIFIRQIYAHEVSSLGSSQSVQQMIPLHHTIKKKKKRNPTPGITTFSFS